MPERNSPPDSINSIDYLPWSRVKTGKLFNITSNVSSNLRRVSYPRPNISPLPRIWVVDETSVFVRSHPRLWNSWIRQTSEDSDSFSPVCQ
jgi:hypothetical protein